MVRRLPVGSAVFCEADHKSLVPVLSSKSLDELPPCIQQFHMRRMRFCSNIFHVPGNILVIADALSRALLAKLTATDERVYKVRLKSILTQS